MVYLYVKNIPLRYLSKIIHLSRYVDVILDCHNSDKDLSCQLDIIDLFPCVVVSVVISISWSNWLDDKRSPLEMSSDELEYWLNGESPPSVYYQVVRVSGSMTKV